MMPGLLKVACVLMCPFIFFACVTAKPSAIDDDLTHQKGDEEIKNGLRVFVRPLTDEQEVEKYFGANLLEKNILPVFVLVENKNPTRYFLVEPAGQDDHSSNNTTDRNGGESKPEGDASISSTGAKEMVNETGRDRFLASTGILGGPIIFLAVLPLAVMSDFQYGPTDASKSLQQALISQAMRKQTLTPGRTEQGFLYYRLPSDSSTDRTIGILIKSTDVETQEVTYFRFTNESALGEK
jgi:hypothetical protein